MEKEPTFQVFSTKGQTKISIHRKELFLFKQGEIWSQFQFKNNPVSNCA
jgi:hypothetical protein